jgi:hypothetical protein
LKPDYPLKEGPPLSAVMARIAETTAPFMREPAGKEKSKPASISAVVSDLIFECGGTLLSAEDMSLFRKKEPAVTGNYLRVVMILCSVYAAPIFREHNIPPEKIMEFLTSDILKERCAIVNAEQFITDPERREELARLSLSAAGLLPEGENSVKALDRLNTIDSIKRREVIEKSKEAQRRAREISEAIARKEAEEAASKMTRE